MLLGEVLKAAWKKMCILRWHRIALYVLEEPIELGREFQIIGADALKQRKPKTRLV